MARCTGCGEALTDSAAACPVCNTLGLPKAVIFDSGESALVTSKDDAPIGGNSLLNAGPVLGDTSGISKASVSDDSGRMSRPVLPGSQKSEETAAAEDTEKSSAVSDEYRQRFEAEAQIFGSDAFTIKRIEELRAKKMPAALFLGGRDAGKTWLLQRMKHQLRAQGFTLRPKFAIEKGELTSEEVQKRDTEEYRKEFLESEDQAANVTYRSTAIIVHRFLAQQGSFALIDIPGEQIEDLVDGNYATLRGLMAALEYASIIIIALPADAALLGEEIDEHDELKLSPHYANVQANNERLSNFEDGLFFLASVRSLLRNKKIQIRWKAPADPPDEFDREVTLDNVETHSQTRGFEPIGGRDGIGCPTYFALTKADKLLAAMDILPDCASANAVDEDRFKKGNKALQSLDEDAFLKTLYDGSTIKKRALLNNNGLLSQLWGRMFGKAEVLTQLSNPPEMMQLARPVLFNGLTEFFPMSRFDLVAAFYGHTRNTLKKEDFNRMPSAGVDQLVDWLDAIHNEGIGKFHIWARRVYTRIYGEKLKKRSPFGGHKNKAHVSWLNFAPVSFLKNLFEKKFRLAWLAPWSLALVGIPLVSWLSFNWLEQTGQYSESGNYTNLMKELEKKSPDPEALKAIKRSKKDSANALAWPAAAQLNAWNPEFESGPIIVPDTFLAPTAEDERLWQSEYVCGLKGWDDYRDIVRKAAINGYGDCSGLTKFAMHSPLIDGLQAWLGYWLGLVFGIVLLALGWVLALGTALLIPSYLKTRKAFGWFYHSGVATTRRPDPGKPNPVQSE